MSETTFTETDTRFTLDSITDPEHLTMTLLFHPPCLDISQDPLCLQNAHFITLKFTSVDLCALNSSACPLTVPAVAAGWRHVANQSHVAAVGTSSLR